MEHKTITSEFFTKMLINGAANLRLHIDEINNLNVFPIPDGDTGTNMHLTINAGANKIKILDFKTKTIAEIAKVFSHELVVAAHGNSGVILSQFFRGFAKELAKVDSQELTVVQLIDALISGYKVAYSGVVQPIEGTILTVLREAGEHLRLKRGKLITFEDTLTTYFNQAKITLQKTPTLLPVLKEANVVDSGGAGFVKIVEGFVHFINGKVIKEATKTTTKSFVLNSEQSTAYDHVIGEIKFKFCTEFVLILHKLEQFSKEKFIQEIKDFGDSMVVIHDEELLKVHIHTNQPLNLLKNVEELGEVRSIKVDNMKLQNEEAVAEQKPTTKTPEKEYGLIAVANGDGVRQYLLEHGVDYIVAGGQTMNPSTQDFIEAVEKVNAKNIIIIPNNSNIIMSAEQTANLVKDRNIAVIKTKNLGQGVAALSVFDHSADFKTNIDNMQEIAQTAQTGEITYAIRDTKQNGIDIRKGHYLGISEGAITCSVENIFDATRCLLSQILSKENEVVTLFYGKAVSDEEAREIEEYIQTLCPYAEVNLVNGMQEIYLFIVSAL